MNLGQMRARVRAATHDSAGRFITPAEVDNWLNDAYVDIVARLRLLTKQTTVTMGDAGTDVVNGTIDLPADFLVATSLRTGTLDADPVSDEDFWRYSDAGASFNGHVFRIFENKIELYPAPAAGTEFKLRYSKRPAELAENEEEPEISPELHPKMVKYAISEAALKEKDVSRSDRERQDYERDLPPPAYRQRNMPGPFSMSFEGGPFDTLEATHN